MAQLKQAPKYLVEPVFNARELDQYDEDIENYKSLLKTYCESNSTCPDAGKILRFQVGDGFAIYMVFNHKDIIFINQYDEYEMDIAFIKSLSEKKVRSLV